MKIVYPVITTLLLMLFSLKDIAQVVNIEKKREDLQKDGIQGNIELSLNYTKNDAALFQAKNKFQLQYFKGNSTFLLFNELSQIKTDNKNFLNDGFLHLRYNYSLPENFVTLEMFTQYQYNSIKKLKHRYLTGAGPRIKIIDTTTVRIFFAPLLMYEYEMLTIDSSPHQKFRLSSYLSFSYKLNDQLNFIHISYFQPWIVDFSNFRVSSESTLIIKITEKLSLKIIYELIFDSHPPEDVSNLFYSISNGLNYKF